MPIPITLTRAGRVIATRDLYDGDDRFMWHILHIVFTDDPIRTITRTNAGWSVDLEQEEL